MTSLEQFLEGVSEVRTLLAVCATGSSDDGDVDTRNNAVCRASTVLLVSHFESFVKSLTEDFMDAISTGTIESRAIPVGIRELHSLPRTEEIIGCSEPAQRASLLRKMTEYGCLWVPDAKPPQGLLKASALSRKVTNADSQAIDEVFGLMGASSPVCDGEIDVDLVEDGSPTPVNIRLMLRDVVKCRNDIAHGDADRIPTVEDVDRCVRQLAAFARRLDARVAQLIAAVGA